MRLATLTTLTLLALAGLSSNAYAGPLSAHDDAILSRSSLESLEPDLLSDSDLELPIVFEPYKAPSIRFSLPELAPESLEIEVRLSPLFTVYIAADLTADLPRLDAMDGDTYFAPGLTFHVTRQFSLYVEDFQPASGVTGAGDTEEVVPDRSWDGHQVSLGARLRTDRVSCQAAAVVYTLSSSRRDSSVGIFASLTLLF